MHLRSSEISTEEQDCVILNPFPEFIVRFRLLCNRFSGALALSVTSWKSSNISQIKLLSDIFRNYLLRETSFFIKINFLISRSYHPKSTTRLMYRACYSTHPKTTRRGIFWPACLSVIVLFFIYANKSNVLAVTPSFFPISIYCSTPP